MLDLDLIRTFVAVVDCGGFTRAAERVHRTQSTVSQQIRKLEEGLGHKLLARDRTGAALTLTEEGERFLGYARRLVDISTQAQEAMRHSVAPSVVRLGIPEDFAGRRLMELLSGFAHRCPHIRLDTTSGWSAELNRLLDAGELDLSLVKRDVGAGSSLAYWPERLFWVASADIDIAMEPLPLALFPQGCIYRRRAVDAIEVLGRRWRTAYVGQGLAGVQAAISAGIGIGLLAEDAIQPDHKVLSLADGFPAVPASELALIASSRRLSQPVSELTNYLRFHIGNAM